VINALRHANPRRVDIEVEGRGAQIHVRVTDDGAGLPADWSKPGHFGLRGLTERVNQLGGRFEVGNHGDGGGTRLIARIPLEFTPAAGRRA
jgi:two-component system sensor histidine kinase UhpB